MGPVKIQLGILVSQSEIKCLKIRGWETRLQGSEALRQRLKGYDLRERKYLASQQRKLAHVRADINNRADIHSQQPRLPEMAILFIVDPTESQANRFRMPGHDQCMIYRCANSS